jgi:AraC family transcriptional regulator, transcriptional activator of pobA
MDQTGQGWYFSWIVRSKGLAPSRGIRTVEFHRTKYGRELLVDVVRASDIPTIDADLAPHVLSFYEIFLITRGRGSLALDGRTYPAHAGTVFFTSPGQPRRWSLRGFDGLCLFFTSEFIEDFFNDPLFLFTLPYFHREDAPLGLKLRSGDAATLRRRLERMRREVRRLRADSAHVLRAGLYETLLLLARQYESSVGQRPAENPTALRLRRLIERDFREQHQPLHYARKLRITTGHLNHLARRHLGRTAGDAIRERLLLEAKRRLRHSDAAAAEIAYDLGFKDPAYFARFFRRCAGEAPSEFRRARRV